jgi:protein O-GlcNAc transferase
MSRSIYFLQKAIESIQSGDLSLAEDYATEALKISPKSFDCLNILGSIKLSRGKIKDALDMLLIAESLKENNFSLQFNLAKAYMDDEKYLESLQHHRKAILLKSNNPDAYINYAKSLCEINLIEEAINCYDKAIKINPKDYEVWFFKGLLLGKQSKYEDAVMAFDKAIQICPTFWNALISKADILNNLNQYDEALAHYDRAIQIKPDYAEAWSNKAVTLHALKRYDEALAHYDRAIQIKPDYAEAWSNKGVTFKQLNQYDEALAHYDRAIQIKPDYAEAWSNKGVTFKQLNQYDEALAHYDRAIQIKPDYAEAWSNKAVTLHALKRYDEALAHYDRAIQIKPDYAEAWSNKGVTFKQLNQYDEALAHYDRAIQIKPDYAEAWSNKALLLKELGNYEDVIFHYEKALTLNPDMDWVSGDLLHTKMKISSWLGLTEDSKNILKKVMANNKVISPFSLAAINDDGALLKKAAQIFSQDKYPIHSSLCPIPKRTKKEKIRIAYFSPDFRNHAVSLLTVGLFENHDRSRFEVFGFSLKPAPDGDLVNLRLRQGFDKFLDVDQMSDKEIACLAQEYEVDIAIDLAGHTQNSRTGIFSYRAAPIQISYIGYLGTMGSEYYDYLFADITIIPNELQKFYSEKIVYLPSYQANDRKRTISERQFTRKELGLPEAGFVFCCFNNTYKIVPSTFDGWMRILNAVEGSVLFLYADNEWAKVNLIKEAGLRGIDSGRLIFGGRFSVEEYLARYRVCDLFLDTFPYNAGTTASDALWVELPVLTLMGQSFASRVAASILNAIGLSELITDTQEEYENLAIELATNPEKLGELKKKLSRNRFTEPLFDTPLFTKHIEAAYTQMYELHNAGLEPDHINIA